MAHYVDIDRSTASQILSLYGLNLEIEAIIPLSHGISNTNYKIVTHQKNLLLKVSNDKGIDQLKKEQKILLFLKATQFPFSLTPFPLLSGEHVYHHPPYFGVIYPFVEGKVPEITPSTCKMIGEGLAKLHRVSTKGPLPSFIRPASEVGHDALNIQTYVEKNPSCPTDFREAFSKVFPDHLRDYLAQNWTEGLIHGDLYYDNSLFQDGELKVLLDFEQSGKGEFLFDLGISISGTCLNQGRIDRALVNNFLEGYEKVRPLPSQERDWIDTSILLGLFSISLWRIKRFTEGNLDPQKADSYRELLNRALLFQNEN